MSFGESNADGSTAREFAHMLDVQPRHARRMPAFMLVHFPVLEEHDFATIEWLHAMIEGTHDGNAEMLRDSSDRMYIKSTP
jgi:hypothetical protein